MNSIIRTTTSNGTEVTVERAEGTIWIEVDGTDACEARTEIAMSVDSLRELLASGILQQLTASTAREAA
ncbi:MULTISPECIES: hypothetical protein [Rhodococcus]|uniref:hypothetical protein n=1 Tax=Rhodococcus TaxID=1827 RepID=UPI00228588E9|nr:hypothetical protein [Rhodococcus sp. JS3073]WAM13945.1 hypothetical protein OYT95_31665 [Rhodococcus sp. JS3073]